MTSPIDPNAPPNMPASQSAASNDISGSSSSTNIHADGINPADSRSLNIPNDGQNYQWFLTESTGSRTTISATNQTGNPTINQIGADMGVNDIASLILSHIRSAKNEY